MSLLLLTLASDPYDRPGHSCRVAVPSAKDELEPGFPLPTAYPLRFCAPGHRFSALVIVRR